MTTREVELDWRPSRLAVALAVVAAAALAAAIVLRSGQLVAFAAPLLGALAAGAIRVPGRPATVTVTVDPADSHCFEGETVEVAVRAARLGLDQVAVRMASTPGVEVTDSVVDDADGQARHRFTLKITDWGRFAPEIALTAHAGAGLLTASAFAHPVHVRAYPRPAPMTGTLSAADMPDRVGAHLARRRGEGVEFAGIRPYVPGDQLRNVNWAVTARRGTLHVTERLAERSADVVALIDTYALHADPGAAGQTAHSREAMKLAAHGATEVVQAALRHGDRAGVIALGGRLRWLGPDIGMRQFYRVVDAVLDAYPTPDDTHRGSAGRTDFVPRGVMPTGAVIVAFTPLLDARIALGLHDVRLRGYAVLVVDVLRDIPRVGAEPVDPLVDRMWRLERGRMHRNFALLGIPVVPWRAETALDEVIAPLARRPLAARRPAG